MNPADHLLSLLVVLPLVGAAVTLVFSQGEVAAARAWALSVALANLAVAATIWGRFDAGASGLQLVERGTWVRAWGIDYAVGIDALSLPLVLLSAVLVPIALAASAAHAGRQGRELFACLLGLQAAMMGALVAADLVLFYLFWESSLLPAYFLVGIWGGEGRTRAAAKFFVTTAVGSLAMLLAVVSTAYLVSDAAGTTFATDELARRIAARQLGARELPLFLAFACAFAIKLPIFPLHTWLPPTYVAAPPAATALLAGMLGKLGAYGLLRYAFWLFPHAAGQCLPALMGLGVLGTLYGALVAVGQDSLRRVLAFSSLSHLGFIVLGMAGMTAIGLSGSLLQMFSHGISTAALFLLAGMLHERRGGDRLGQAGLARAMPRAATAFVVLTMAAIGLPGLSGFVGEFLILLGTFSSPSPYAAALSAAATLAVVVAAIYLLRVVQRLFFGPVPAGAGAMRDLSVGEQATLLPLVALSLALGLWPQPLLAQLAPGAEAYVDTLRARAELPPSGEARGARPPARPVHLPALPGSADNPGAGRGRGNVRYGPPPGPGAGRGSP